MYPTEREDEGKGLESYFTTKVEMIPKYQELPILQVPQAFTCEVAKLMNLNRIYSSPRNPHVENQPIRHPPFTVGSALGKNCVTWHHLNFLIPG